MLSEWLGIEIPNRQGLFPLLIKDLKWANIVDRGFIEVTFNYDKVDTNWIFVDTILSKNYSLLPMVSLSSEGFYFDDIAEIEDEDEDEDAEKIDESVVKI